MSDITVPIKEPKAGTIVSVVISLVSIGALSPGEFKTSGIGQDYPSFVGFAVDLLKRVVAMLGLLCENPNIFLVPKLAVIHSILMFEIADFLLSKMTTKFIIRRSSKPRLKDTLYLFNSFGMLIPYCVVIALNFYLLDAKLMEMKDGTPGTNADQNLLNSRFAVWKDGSCRIGMKRVAMIPLIGFDILVNVYLTSLFLIPLRSLYSYKNNRNSQARTVALRTFIGSCCTLVSSVVHVFPPYELGLREWGLGGGLGGKGVVGVTTRVVGGVGTGTGVGDSGDEEEGMEELRRIESLPPGVVSVETRTVQVLGSGENLDLEVGMRGGIGDLKKHAIEEVESVVSLDEDGRIVEKDLERTESKCDGERQSTEDLFPKAKE
ncbi:uncharacterized protein PAC_02102 [Phialocephala subalpina]|uniref:Uncharacterized protein n=1 Tax=Phialocephala subalpina TaxID=576137 RepID=A0A1L7WHJ0_9HELO|nr:uncharacterized protein PAC_02102 [Phialocephala subalpina]